jgi:hypothetical protein
MKKENIADGGGGGGGKGGVRVGGGGWMDPFISLQSGPWQQDAREQGGICQTLTPSFRTVLKLTYFLTR